MNKKKVMLYIVILVFMINFVAGFKLSNYSIEEEYSPNENIKGWINISFKDESSNALFSSNFQGSEKLIDFLEENSAEYSCTPVNCESDYVTTNSEEEKSFSLSYGEEKLIAFVLNGKLKNIDDLHFNVSVNNPASCINPLEIDILNDEEIEWKSKKASNEYECVYEEGTGCFDTNENTNYVRIGQTPYCEKITLTESESFRLGAWVKKGSFSWETGLLKMILYNLDGEEQKYCKLPEPSLAGGEIFCDINYTNEKTQEHYVCIKSTKNTDYEIKTESIDSCGFYGYPPEDSETEYHDYYIFGKGAKFVDIGEFSFNKEEDQNLVEKLENYIEEKYENNCSEGCKIPVKFKSYSNLNIQIDNLDLSYSTGAGLQPPEKNIYDASEKPAEITSGFLKLDLSYLNISVPEKPGEYTLRLELNGIKILNKKIEVLNVPSITSLYPTIVPAATPAKFNVKVSLPTGRNITSYKWDFGDNSSKETKINSVTHTYASIKNYEMTTEVKDNLGYKTSRKFTIRVGSPKEAANYTIQNYKKRLNNLSFEINSVPSWYRSIIEKKINVSDLISNINKLEKEYGQASEDDYVYIMAELAKMKVPYKIATSLEGEIPFFVDYGKINPEYIKELGAGSYDDSEEYKKAIAFWAKENLNLKLKYKYVSAYYDDNIEDMTSVFSLNINSYGEAENLYVLIQIPKVLLNGNYGVKGFSDATGISLSGIKQKEIEFASSAVDLSDLIVYLSPDFKELTVVKIEPCNFNGVCEKEENENWKNCREDCKPWGVVSILLVIIFFAGLLTYILLQWWYKTKYESHLFKNRNDVYNLVSFMKNAQNQGMSFSEIKDSLRKAGWNGEQISYAFKKLRGKAITPFDFLKLFRKSEREKIQSRALTSGKPLLAGFFI